MGFGQFIRSKREQSGIVLNDFARRIGISPAYWSRIERELEKPPRDDLIFRASEVLFLNQDEAFIEAGRLPPDLVKDLGRMVKLYRERGDEPHE